MGSKLNVNLTVTDAVYFYGTSENRGTITAPVVEFFDSSKNLGTVNGDAVFHDETKNGTQQMQTFDPPLKCVWRTSSSSGVSKRQLVCLGSRNPDQLSSTINGGDWQECPSESCFAYPATYRQYHASVNFVIDYEDKPNYLDEPGNPEEV